MGNDPIYRGSVKILVPETWWDEIDSIPAVDAVEVVRCGECKYMMPDGRCYEFADPCVRPSASDFCSYGERREDGDGDV